MPSFLERREWLDAEVLAALYDLARKRLKNQTEIDDVVSTTCMIVLEKIQDPAKGPQTRAEMRPWACGILKKVLLAHWRKKKEAPPVVQPDDVPELSAEDERDVAIRLYLHDRNHQIVQELVQALIEKKSEHAGNIQILVEQAAGNLRIKDVAKERGIEAPALRKSVSRSREFLKGAAVSAGVAFAIWLVVSRSPSSPDSPIQPATPTFTEAGLAAGQRELARRDCDAQRWKSCLKHLDEAKGLDPAGDNAPDVQRARQDVGSKLAKPPQKPEWLDVAKARQDGLEACQDKKWAICLNRLDSARKYDPEGDMTDEITAARATASAGLQGMLSSTLDNAKAPPAPGPLKKE